MDLEGKGLRYKVVGTGNEITNQVPKSGAEVEIGSEVILYVTKSEADSGSVKVPDVMGKSYSDAVDILSDAGFEVVFEGDTDGFVAAQDPKHGISVDKGSEIKIKLTEKKEATEQKPETTT